MYYESKLEELGTCKVIIKNDGTTCPIVFVLCYI